MLRKKWIPKVFFKIVRLINRLVKRKEKKMGNLDRLAQIQQQLNNLKPAIDAGVQDKGLLSTKAKLEKEKLDLEIQEQFKKLNSVLQYKDKNQSGIQFEDKPREEDIDIIEPHGQNL